MENHKRVTSFDLALQDFKLIGSQWRMIHRYNTLSENKKIMVKSLLNQKVFIGRDYVGFIVRIITVFYGLHHELFGDVK